MADVHPELINGANGGLGRLAMQVLQPWGSRITAICGKDQHHACMDLGAEVAVEHGPGCIMASIADVLALEREPDGMLPNNTYEMIGAAASTHPDAPALSFFLRVQDYAQPQVWTYETLFSCITAAANFLHELGVGSNDVVALVLPNLPQTQLAIWGGQAVGIAFAIKPCWSPRPSTTRASGFRSRSGWWTAPLPTSLA